jgi:anthranilate synthase component 1
MTGVRYKPDLDEFLALSKQGNVVPVCRTLLGDTLTPVSAYDKFARGEYSFLLESAAGGEKLARYSFLGTNPFMVFRARGNEVEVESFRRPSTGLRAGTRKFRSNDPLAELQKQVFAFRAVGVPGLPRFCGGAVGYAAYDAIRYIERLPQPPPDPLGLPDLYFAFYDLMVVFDHLEKTVLVICSARLDEMGSSSKARGKRSAEAAARRAYERAVARIDEAVERLRTPVMKLSDDITPRGEITLPFRSNYAPAGGDLAQARAAFGRAVERCKEYILAGDIFQVVLSQRLTARTQALPFNVYRALRVINPSPYMFYLQFGDLRLAGSSPEVMVKSESGKVTVRPIAGTRPRGATDDEDAALAAELLADPKERAEHIMLLDLGRNDVGRICRYGTVKIEEEMIIERFSHVMHMTSMVTGMLDAGKSCFDAFRNCFPAGTVSGAPKIRAMEILDELEPVKRGPYAGAVGYVDFRGNLDTCIAIRTLIFAGQEVIVQAGAGIVADSVPDREFEETLNKARGLLRAIQVAESLEPS